MDGLACGRSMPTVHHLYDQSRPRRHMARPPGAASIPGAIASQIPVEPPPLRTTAPEPTRSSGAPPVPPITFIAAGRALVAGPPWAGEKRIPPEDADRWWWSAAAAPGERTALRAFYPVWFCRRLR